MLAGMIFVLMGPSGSGKTTLAKHLKSLGLFELISCTTREPRDGEINGVDYYFYTEEEFDQIPMIEKTTYSNRKYGTSINEVEKKINKGDCFAVVDSHGAEQFRAIYGDLVRVIYVYVKPKLAAERMRLRGDNEDAIADRIRHGFKKGEFDNFDFADFIIKNRNLEESKKLLRFLVGLPQLGDW